MQQTETGQPMAALNEEARSFLRWLDAMEEVPAIGRENPSRALAESLAQGGWLRRVKVRPTEPDGAFVLSGVAVSAISTLQSDPPVF